MRRILYSILLILISISVANAQNSKVSGYAGIGGNSVSIAGVSSTTKWQQSYPNCTVTVFNFGTAVQSTIFSDSTGTAKANPFTADSTGYWFFYAPNGRYDVRFSGTGITTPFTISDYKIGDATSGSGTVTSVGMTVPTFLSISGSPVTSSGTLAISLSGTALPITSGGTGSVTQNFVDITTAQTNIAGAKTFTSPMTHVQVPTADAGQGSTIVTNIVRGADSTLASPISGASAVNPSTFFQTFRTGGVQGTTQYGFLQNFQVTGVSHANINGSSFIGRITPNMTGATTGTFFYELDRVYGILSATNIDSGAQTHNLVLYSRSTLAERTVTGVRSIANYEELRNSTALDTSDVIDRNTTFARVTSQDGTSHNTGLWYAEGPSNATSAYFGIKFAANSIVQVGFDFTATISTLQGLWTADASNTLTRTSGGAGHANVEVVAGDWLLVNGTYVQATSATADAIVLTANFSGTPASGLTITKSVQPIWLSNQSFISAREANPLGSARYSLIGLDFNDNVFIDRNGKGTRFGSYTSYGTNTIGTPSDTLTSGWRIVAYAGGSGANYGWGIEPGFLFYMAGGGGGHKFYVNTSTDTSGLALTIASTKIGTFASDLLVSGLLKAGTSPTTLTDSAGKILALALNTVTVPVGGTGLTSTTAFALLAGGTTGTGNLQQVSGVGTSGQVLTSNGAGALPTWQANPAGFSDPMTTRGDIIIRNAANATARLAVGAANRYLSSDGTDISYAQVNVASGVTGIMTVPNGGTGVATFTSNGVLFGNGAGVVQVTAQGAANTVLVANAGSPSFSAAVTIGTSITSPLHYGGSGVGSDLTINATSGVSDTTSYISLNPSVGGSFPGTVFIGTSNTTSLSFAGSTDVLHLQGQDSAFALIYLDSYGGATSGAAGLVFRESRGTSAAPTASLSGDSIATFGGRPYGTTSFAGGNRATIQFKAAENITDAAQGMNITFETTPIGSTARAVRYTVDDSGNFISAGKTHANLGTPANGSMVFCSDCQVTSGADNTCAALGSGCLAVRLNGVWRCFATQN